MSDLEKSIKEAIDNGLFSSKNKSNENNIFDIYGNYYFPTDFSDDEENSILAVLPIKPPKPTEWN